MKTRKEHEQDISYRLAAMDDAVRGEEKAKRTRENAHEALIVAITAALNDEFEVKP